MLAMNAAPEPSAAPADDAPRAAPAPRASCPSDALFTTLVQRAASARATRGGAGRAGRRRQRDDAAARGLSRHVAARCARPSPTAAASSPMRRGRCARCVIDRARAGAAQKRGGGLDITSLDTQTAESVAEPAMLSDIGAALDELAEVEPELANVVDLKFFCGFARRRDRGHAWRLRAHRPAPMGEGAAAAVPGARRAAVIVADVDRWRRLSPLLDELLDLDAVPQRAERLDDAARQRPERCAG